MKLRSQDLYDNILDIYCVGQAERGNFLQSYPLKTTDVYKGQERKL